MTRVTPRKRAILFFIALALPCAGLVALGARMAWDGEELARSRQSEEQARLTFRIANELTSRLERIRVGIASAVVTRASDGDAASIVQPEVALTAWVPDGHLELPWDRDPDRQRFAAMLRARDTPFAQARARGERQETLLQFSSAAESLAQARRLAESALEADYAALVLARVFAKGTRSGDARLIYESLLTSRVRDDEGVPLAWYAARRLLELGAPGPPLLDTLDTLSAPGVVVGPASAYLARDILGALARSRTPSPDHRRIEALSTLFADRIADIDRALALQLDIERIMPSLSRTSGSTPVWVPFDKAVWLLSASRVTLSRPTLLVAVRTSDLAAAIARTTGGIGADSLRFSSDSNAGQPLGDGLPGLRVSFASTDADAALNAWRRQRFFYAAALMAVVAATIAGGLVLWRDVRRELRIAEMRSQFVASVSHELKTPLTAIRMFAETLQMERPLAPANRSEYLDTIVSESERLTRLIGNLLDYSKIERGQKVYHFEPTTIDGVVRKAAATMRYPLERRGFDLRLDLSASPLASIDEDAMEQAVLNLLNNAMKYSSDRREIDLKVSGESGHAVIEVTDYGLGIPADEQPKIFGRFYRAAVPENARIAGAGLGLALVDHIVKAHGGHVSVRSAPGRGSTFAIHVPVLPDRAGQAAPETSS